MSNMGFILLMSDVDGIVYMILGLFFILTISYGIGCLGRKRKIGFGWAFFYLVVPKSFDWINRSSLF